MVLRRATVAAALAALAACGGGGGDGDQTGCRGDCSATPTALDVADVERVVRQAVHEAQARGVAATIAVVDRVGNVLAVFQMTGAAPNVRVGTNRGVMSGLEGAMVPAQFAALAKAITGAYLSSEGNAFSSRTASQIVQENFNPGERNSPSGPLFGVQFSSLTCSDVVNVSAGVVAGPKGTPLGLSADPGGLPLYKSGTVVGGVGVMADGAYGLDPNIFDVDQDLDELIAVAATRGFDAPVNRRADRITADGRTLRYVDSEATLSNPATAPAFAMLPGVLVDMPGFFSPAAVRAGTAFGTPASGYRPQPGGAFAGLNAFVLDDGAGTNRFPPIAGSLLTQVEVETILVEALRVANRTRGQIRQPLGSAAQVSITVVDTNGTILGLVRTGDGPVFGTDVAVQKARGALQLSHPSAASELAAVAGIAVYVNAMQALIPNALSDGTAYSARTIGNLARPFLPDGINTSTSSGPLSRPFADWSPFTTGLQLDLVAAQVVANLPVPVPGAPCTGLARAPNGIQIFPGGFPIFRGGTLVGAIGISGDGVDQDDLVAFLGLANAGARLGTGVGNAPAAQRADRIAVPGGQLRYAGCPVAPFLDSTTSDACSGL